MLGAGSGRRWGGECNQNTLYEILKELIKNEKKIKYHALVKYFTNNIVYK